MEKRRENIENGMKIIHEGEKLFEMWKQIEGYPDYQVSSFGRVKRFYKNGNNKILKPGTNENGYCNIKLCKNGKPTNVSVHRLVANAFLKNAKGKKCVDHIDNNRKNNHIHNLRFATHQENQQNSKQSKRNTSGYKGVYWHQSSNKWLAYVTVNRKKFSIGYYNDIQEAVQARQTKAKEIFGEFVNACEV